MIVLKGFFVDFLSVRFTYLMDLELDGHLILGV